MFTLIKNIKVDASRFVSWIALCYHNDVKINEVVQRATTPHIVNTGSSTTLQLPSCTLNREHRHALKNRSSYSSKL